MSQTKKLSVIEIFSSIQGEGLHTGKLVTFIRLAGCNMCCSFCDTDFETGKHDMGLHEILDEVRKLPSNTIVWTGGEPLLQLKSEHLFTGYKHFIETNGSLSPINGLDYITVSPKVCVDTLNRNFFGAVNLGEIRYAVKAGDFVPHIEELPIAWNYYLSPIFNGLERIEENIQYCLMLIERNPRWKMSIQTHKLLNLA